jgi:hypothetical protein
MNLPRLRELLKTWQDGSIREAELLELRDALQRILADAEAWRNGMALLDELRERVIPCGHKIEDLIGGEGSVTKCGACLAAKQAERAGLTTFRLG